MTGILVDINTQGQLRILLQVWESAEWREIWDGLGLTVHTFPSLGLDAATPDDVLWHTCQARQVALLTANRNNDGADSLEEAIRSHNSAQSLPVFTFADAQRIQREAGYAAKVAIKLLEYFMFIDEVRGTGRLYVP